MNDEKLLGFSLTERTADEIALDLLPAKGGPSSSTGKVGPRCIACYNPHSHAIAKSDAAFRQSLLNADILLPDGTGVVLASRICGGRIKGRVTGFDIFLSLLARASGMGGLRVFLLGANMETLAGMIRQMTSDYPNLTEVSGYSPPFADEFSTKQTNAMLRAINDFRPDILFVGMTAPKQEKWVHANRSMIAADVVASIGAVFDFYAGNKSRGPSMIRSLGLEWFARLVQEPRRLWRRTFISAPIFMFDLLKYRMQQW